ncbi:VOC family protein [Aquitalea denitrificans]|uniref:VOC family protein n=1 Tax=Aquitalea denitrificans TaxID=519081 RepID=UPI00135B3A55|nr:VOC family protein [Aquitalea denitrificans]
MAVSGLNHLTLAVADLERAWQFYTALPGVRPQARWLKGGYLLWGDVWLCLSLDESVAEGVKAGYTHAAFSVSAEDFASARAALTALGIRPCKENRSEGDSFYFRDPDGHLLELHAGSLESRLAACRQRPYEGMQWFD